MYTPIFTKCYEIFLSSLYIHKMILFQFTHPFNDFIAIFKSIEEVLDFIIIILL
jgi:hypothetical protein